MTNTKHIVMALVCMAVCCAAEETPNQMRKRLGIPLGEPIPEAAWHPQKPSPAVKKHRTRPRKKTDKELDAAASLVLSFFQSYNKGETQQAWNLLSPEVQKRLDFKGFQTRSLGRYTAVQSAGEQPSARVVAVVGPKNIDTMDREIAKEKVEQMQQWNRINQSIMVYLHPQKPVPSQEPEIFVVKPIDGQLKIVVLPNY